MRPTPWQTVHHFAFSNNAQNLGPIRANSAEIRLAYQG